MFDTLLLALALQVGLRLPGAPDRDPPPRAPLPPAASAPAADEELRAARALALADAGSPRIEEVQAAAARSEVDPAAVRGLERRPRLAAWLPKLSADYRHDRRSLRVVGLQGTSEVDYARFEPGDQVGVRASWSLGELVFSREELDAAKTASELRRRAREAVDRATRLWFERRRLRVALALDPPQVASAWAEKQLELDRITAELDALTGGLYSRGGGR